MMRVLFRLLGTILVLVVAGIAPGAQEPPGPGSDAVEDLEGRLADIRSAGSAGDIRAVREQVRAAVAFVRPLLPQAGLELEELVGELGELAVGCREDRAASELFGWGLERARGRGEERDPEVLLARNRLGVALGQMGDYAAALEHFEAVFALQQESTGVSADALLRQRFHIAASVAELGDLARARSMKEALLADAKGVLRDDDPIVLDTRASLAITLSQLGQTEAARVHFEAVVRALEGVRPAHDNDLLRAREGVAMMLHRQGRSEEALAVAQEVLAIREESLPSDHVELLNCRQNLAAQLFDMGRLHEALELQEHTFEDLEGSVPPDHWVLVQTKANLANTLELLGDRARSRELKREVLASFERTLPANHPNLAVARLNLGTSLANAGEFGEARECYEVALASLARSAAETDPRRLMAEQNLAGIRLKVGDLEGARRLFERVVELLERTQPDDHPQLMRSRQNLAVIKLELGDLDGARALQERVLAARERFLPPNHPDLLTSYSNLADVLREAGQVDRARELQERVLERRSSFLPPGDPQVLQACEGLAITAARAGDDALALELFQRVVQGRRQGPGASALDLLSAEQSVAMMKYRAGALSEAREDLGRIVAGCVERLTNDHPNLLLARENELIVLAAMGRIEEARQRLPALLEGMQQRLLGAFTLSSREARRVVLGEQKRTMILLHLIDGTESEQKVAAGLERQVLELFETMRSILGASHRVHAVARRDPELAELVRRSTELRGRLNDAMVQTATADDLGRTVREAALDRDRIDRAIRERLLEGGSSASTLRLAEVARGLPPGSAAVSYWNVWRRRPGVEEVPEQRVQAHLVRADGSWARLDLGASAESRALVEAWRKAIGEGVERGVGLPRPAGAARAGTAAGTELRRRLLDPVLAACGERPRRLALCADDFLHRVAFEALPTAEGWVGDELRIVSEVSLARLAATSELQEGGRSLLALGAPDYSRASLDPGASSAAHLTAPASAERTAFAPLPHTRLEVERLAELFDDPDQTTLLLGAEATRAAFHRHAPGRRYLHVATHGWYAASGVGGHAGTRSAEPIWTPAEPDLQVGTLAPLLLSGLALAGANSVDDSTASTPGILTAEELAGIDLSACDLAVLSACESYAGLTTPGVGIQSLQAALHAAGARTAITSLWRVDDALTQQLMEGFYTYLWVDGLPKAEALWKAKSDLRAEGHPVRDWGAWVLSGDPD